MCAFHLPMQQCNVYHTRRSSQFPLLCSKAIIRSMLRKNPEHRPNVSVPFLPSCYVYILYLTDSLDYSYYLYLVT